VADSDGDRFSRQRLHWGEEKQRQIAESSILIAGLGGLGATVSQIMARAGVARLHLVDDGSVEWSDLHRQSLYGECDIGSNKVLVTRKRLQAINSRVEIVCHNTRVDNTFCLPPGIRGVADCLDNFTGRFDLYAAIPDGMFFVHGGVQGDQGQVLTLIKGASLPLDEILAGCRQPEGLIPVTPESVFAVASFMSSELFQAISGAPKLLNRFLVVDMAGFTLSFLEV